MNTSAAPTPGARRWWLRALVLAGTALAATAGVGIPSAGAASVSPVPHRGPTGCSALAQRFGGGPYTEVRFSTVPAVGNAKSATRAGVTVTVTRLTPSTMRWTATDGIDLVFVNAGTFPNESSAVYRYDPESAGDSGLGGLNPSDVLDHVVACFDQEQPSPTTTTTTTTTTTVVPPTTQPPVQTIPPTTRPPQVRCVNPPTCQIERVPPPWRSPPTTPAPTTSTVVPRLPEVGTESGPVAVVGAATTVVGVALVLLARRRRAVS